MSFYKEKKEEKSTSNVADRMLSMSSQQPEIHSLARLEGDLALTLAYCQQCQRINEASGRWSKLFGSAAYFDSKNRALENAGRTVRDARNYDINAPYIDFNFAVYKFIRPVLLAFASRLSPYRDASKIRELLEVPINEKLARKKEKLAEYEEFSMQREWEKDRIGDLKKEIKELEEGKKNVLFGGLMSIDMDDFMDYAEKKGLGYVSDLIKGLKKDDIVKHLQETRDGVVKPSMPSKIIGPANEFVSYCSNVVSPSEACLQHRNKLADAQKELFVALNERKALMKEMESGEGFLWDVPIGLLSIMSNEEFETIKNLGLELVKNKLE